MSRSIGRKTGVAHRLSIVSGAAMVAALMAPQAHSASDPTMVFLGEGYNFCDAKLMSAVWGLSIDKAKVEAGNKIIHNGAEGKKTLEEVLVTGRKVEQCFWDETSHGFSEMELLAGLWGVSIPDAKTKVGQLYTKGKANIVVQAVKNAAQKAQTR